jgi:ATP-binding cassette subfamily C protein
MYLLLKDLLKKSIGAIIIIFFAQLLAVSISMITPYFNGMFIDLLISVQDISEIYGFIMLLIFISLLGIAINFIYRLLLLKIKTHISFELNINVLKHLEKVPIEIFEKFNPTYLCQRVKGDSESIVSFWLSYVFTTFMNTFAIVIMLILLFKINFLLFVISLVFIPLYCIVYFLLKKPLYKKGLESTEASNKFYGEMNDLYLRNREIKTEVMFDNEINSLFFGFKSFMKKIMIYNKLVYAFSAADGLMSLCFQIVVFIVGGTQVISKKMTIGEYTMMNTYFSMILGMIKYYFELGQSYQMVQISVNRVKELYNISEEKNGNLIVPSVRSISLKDVNYKYDRSVYQQKINLLINRPGIYAFTGKNGTGKTTLINTIIGINNLGLDGKVYFNELDLHDINMYQLRKTKISIMIQGGKLPSLSVRDYVFTRISEDKFNEIKHDNMCLTTFFSDAFNLTKLIDKNIQNLSSGEKQMVLLFSTIYKEADIYIFDEPTSNIHAKLIESIWSLLRKLSDSGKIVIIISHDRSLTNLCDNSFDMEENKLG